MKSTRPPPPTPRITRQSTGSERGRDRRDHAHSAAAQARHLKTRLDDARRECRHARAENEKLREDHRAEHVAANARFGEEREELYDSLRSADDAHERDIGSSHTQIRMDVEAKYTLSPVIADLHRRVDRRNPPTMTSRRRTTASTGSSRSSMTRPKTFSAV